MTKLRTAKNKGSQFELDCEYNFKKKFEDIKRLGGQGQFMELDLISEKHCVAIECKRHRSFSWNELVGYYNKLKKRCPAHYSCLLVFQANRQPVLIMREFMEMLIVTGFEDYMFCFDDNNKPIEFKFEKHKPIKHNN